MPGQRSLIRAVLRPPLAVVRRLPGGSAVAGLVDALLPREEHRQRAAEGVAAGTPDRGAGVAAEAAIERERERVEEPAYEIGLDPAGHVDSEVELVAESAERGAAEPPGAELRVDEPWEGYRRMKVAEIAARLDGQPAEVLAAVELYESAHRRRRGVLDAVRRYSRVAR